MTFTAFPRPTIAATLGLAMLAGCTNLPASLSTAGGTLAAKTAGRQAAATIIPAATTRGITQPTTATGEATGDSPTAFVETAVKAAVTPETTVDNAEEARALAVNDEAVIEGASAAAASTEAPSAYSLLGARGGVSAQGFTREGFLGCGTAPGPIGVVGDRAAPRPVIRREPPAPAPVRVVLVVAEVTHQLSLRRQHAVERQAQFTHEQPSYDGDQAAINQVLTNQPWQPNDDDEGTLCKTGGATLTTATGTSRKLRVLRVVAKAAPHVVVQGLTDIAEVKRDGSSKTIHWARTLGADGAFRTVYHHEVTCADGRRWITEWEKTLRADGSIIGTGTFTACGSGGEVESEEVVTIGGSDQEGQQVSCHRRPVPTAAPTFAPSTPVPTDTPTPAPSATPSQAPSASPAPAATPTPLATPTPTASPTAEASAAPAPCPDCAVTGGGRLGNSPYAFGFGPQVVTINDVSTGGVELKADVTGVTCSGTTATVTGTLRAPAIGTVTLVVTDNGEGANASDDHVTFLVGGNVVASGPVSNAQPGGGNIQVRGGCD